MNFDRFAGLFAVTALCLIWAIVAWTGVAGPVWRAHDVATPDQWLGFAGAILGALATILTGAAALFAAYKTLVPMRDQLSQLIKQNDHNLIDRLGARAAKLNAEEILIQQAVSGCDVVNKALPRLLGRFVHADGLAAFETAVNRLEGFVVQIQIKKGDVWGDVATQQVRRNFIDVALGCATLAMKMLQDAQEGTEVKSLANDWSRMLDEIHAHGEKLFRLVSLESGKIGRSLAEVEARLFGEKGI